MAVALKMHTKKDLNRPVIISLLENLQRRSVRFCHWKSNARLEETLSGGEDIDVLVHRQDAALFNALLLEHGFKLAVSRTGISHPGVFHAFALDETSSELVHLHAFHQIVSGDSLVKNYRLQIEDLLLEQTRTVHGVPIPDAAVELVVFALRVALKHASLFEAFIVNRSYPTVIAELRWLQGAASTQEAAALCASHFPGVGSVLFENLIEAIGDNKGVFRRLVIGRRVAWRLRHLRRMGALQSGTSRLFRVMTAVLGRIRRRKDKMLQTGGAIVALVGPKATGKSTLGAALAARLGQHLHVERIHAGKPPATALTVVPRLMLPIIRRMFRKHRPSEYQKPERRAEKRYSLIYVLHMTMLAYERRSLLQRALRVATAGGVVVSDRYPSEASGAIDSSCFDDESLARCSSKLKRWLMGKERAFYRGLPKPDVVIRLQAPMELTLQRDATRAKPGGPDAQAVQNRWGLETRPDSFGAREVLVRTDRSIDATVREVVQSVWQAL